MLCYSDFFVFFAMNKYFKISIEIKYGMMIKTVFNFLVRKQPFREKCKIGINFLKYYLAFQKYYFNFKNGRIEERLKTVYHNLTEQNIEVNNFLKGSSKEDHDLFDSLFISDVKNFLHKKNILTNIIPSEKLGMNQVGFNSIYVEKPDSFWTTGNATFFLPTKKNVTNNITIQIASVPEMNIIFGFENDVVMEIKMPRFSEKTIRFSIDPSKIKNDISKIFITTDKLWKPDVLRNQTAKVVFGIRIDSIKISYSKMTLLP
jgi:hypothetical protein